MKALLNRLFGFRWTLYIACGPKQIAYAMHADSVLKLVGLVMKYFANGARPIAPWSLHLNFNKQHVAFELLPEHFSADGEHMTQALRQQIEAIDPGWRVRGRDPVFVEAATRKSLPIMKSHDLSSPEAFMKSATQPEGTTFFSVMDEVFGCVDQ